VKIEEQKLLKYGLEVDWLGQLTGLIQDHLHRLQHGPYICGAYCDATYLGLIMIFNKEGLLLIYGNKEGSGRVYGPPEVFKTLSVWKEKLHGIYCGERSRANFKPDHINPDRDMRCRSCINRTYVLGNNITACMSKMDFYLRSISRLKLAELGI
jgi:hypothetical protein